MIRHALAALALVALAGACKKSDDKPAAPPTPVATADAGAGAAQPPGDAGAVAPASKHVRPFFYKVEKDGQTSYVLGTMHIGIEPERLPPHVWSALDGAKAFAMETNVQDPSLLGMLMRNDGKTLEDDLGKEYWTKLETALGKDMAAGIRGMKASTAAALLELRGLPMTAPMDIALVEKAKEGGKEIIYLEEAKHQQQLLDRWLDVRALKMMLDDLDQAEGKSKQMLDAYAAGDEAKVEALSTDRSAWKQAGRDEAEFEQMLKELLLDRNAAWIPAIEKMHAAGGGFVAVGAAHLIGKGSVLELLRGKGYTVTRVEAP